LLENPECLPEDLLIIELIDVAPKVPKLLKLTKVDLESIERRKPPIMFLY